ncbi:flagellar filament capping protein FliD [Lederbergia lenta]|uniref:Flagellar hook-associated protein 2 n=1 Tax=Lederbergia lenta TaxID=1467 RepID=A0A2X4WW19_LEDLE|nr:flagellar filament capping protein FliD [Lederbergia lenta]MEC2322841.1 flagellar filament capping protein FliD [Lederbergia lenta]SQI61910.1 flagellar hook-associated 2 domain-containing protein [Lederbergia lenta]
MRIAGLASGMDIDMMVKNLMQAERLPLDKLKQKKQILEWQRDDYRSINTQLLSFRDKLAQLKLTPNYRARTVTSSNEDKVSATVTSGASQASYSISQVEQLATAATRKNAGKVTIDPTKSLGSQNMGDNFWSQGVVQSKTFNVKEENKSTFQLQEGTLKDPLKASVKVNGQSMEVIPYDSSKLPEKGQVAIDSAGNLTFNEALAKDSVVKVDYILVEKKVEFQHADDAKDPLKNWNIGAGSIASATITINSVDYKMDTIVTDGFAALKNGDTVIGKINPTTGAIIFEPGLEKGTKVDATFKQNYSAFEIETHTSKGKVKEQFYITENDTLNSVIRKVNESDAGVTMFYDSHTQQMTLTRKETGDFNKDTLDDDGKVTTRNAEIVVSGDFMEKVLHFNNDMEHENGGQNAKFTINGLATERNSNTFDMNGVTFTLKQTFAESPGESVAISIGNDSNQVFENIKGFVDQYNELIAEIGNKLTEKKNRDYKPLTDEEREELSDKQIEKWEDLARSGLLRNDPALSGVISAMRLDISSNVETNGLFSQLASIGISTTSNYMEGGKLEINEAKLKEALEKDPGSVENLFRGTGSDAGRGIVHKLYDTVDASIKKVQDKAGRATSTDQQFALGRELLNVGKGIDRFEDKMKIVEARYWKQFTAMEQAIQKANSQSAYLMQQFSGF